MNAVRLSYYTCTECGSIYMDEDIAEACCTPQNESIHNISSALRNLHIEECTLRLNDDYIIVVDLNIIFDLNVIDDEKTHMFKDVSYLACGDWDIDDTHVDNFRFNTNIDSKRFNELLSKYENLETVINNSFYNMYDIMDALKKMNKNNIQINYTRE